MTWTGMPKSSGLEVMHKLYPTTYECVRVGHVQIPNISFTCCFQGSYTYSKIDASKVPEMESSELKWKEVSFNTELQNEPLWRVIFYDGPYGPAMRSRDQPSWSGVELGNGPSSGKRRRKEREFGISTHLLDCDWTEPKMIWERGDGSAPGWNWARKTC